MYTYYSCLYSYHIVTCIGSDKPTTKELVTYANEVATNWYYLGIQLDLRDKQLDIIKSDNPLDTKMCCTKMFQYWVQEDPTASWNKLIHALENINYGALAETIRKKKILASKYDCYIIHK